MNDYLRDDGHRQQENSNEDKDVISCEDEPQCEDPNITSLQLLVAEMRKEIMVLKFVNEKLVEDVERLKEDGRLKRTEIDVLKTTNERTQTELKSMVNSTDFIGGWMEKLGKKIEKNESSLTSLQKDVAEKLLLNQKPGQVNPVSQNQNLAHAQNFIPREPLLPTPLWGTCLLSDQKQLMGERLFPMVRSLQPLLAGQIVSMLLTIDNNDLLKMMENQTLLSSKVNQAVQVLNNPSQKKLQKFYKGKKPVVEK